MGSNPSGFKGKYLPVESVKYLPVESVNWDECQNFITKLNELTGQKFRLPTEAEWEFAARGGNQSKGYTYSGSNDIDGVAWYEETSSDQTHEVATKIPNELGIYDMSGNVWEWCQDFYDGDYYYRSPKKNPTGPSSGDYRVIRGGDLNGYEGSCRVDKRNILTPTDASRDVGFRLAQ